VKAFARQHAGVCVKTRSSIYYLPFITGGNKSKKQLITAMSHLEPSLVRYKKMSFLLFNEPTEETLKDTLNQLKV
jgi:hypothetical protein